jgi:hypothetical protein
MVLLGADDNSAPTLIDDRETVVLWGKACESLRSIVLRTFSLFVFVIVLLFC